MKDNEFAVAFYNLENLFDTKDDPHTLDDDFTPNGFKRWRKKRLYKKLNKLANAIAHIGDDEGVSPPVLVGVAEVENNNVIEKLLATEDLAHLSYDYVHFDSPDERGIDTALLYHSDYFTVIASETLPLLLEDEAGQRDYTRDILYVHGTLNNEPVHLFINHWPSRRDGTEETAPKRIKAAHTILTKLHQLSDFPESLHVIIMGDFNDDPRSESIKTIMQSGWFINPFEKLLSPSSGSANYKGQWSLFDQILLSHNFLNYEKDTHMFDKAAIFAPEFLKEWKGRYKGNPFRTFAGKKYLGGVSDHFPVYIKLILKK